MESGGTFRAWIEGNKKAVLKYLVNKGWQSTSEIMTNYTGEKDIYQVRRALRELKEEGKVQEQVRYVNSKYWRLRIG